MLSGINNRSLNRFFLSNLLLALFSSSFSERNATFLRVGGSIIFGIRYPCFSANKYLKPQLPIPRVLKAITNPVIQCFSTFFKSRNLSKIIIWRNLNAPYGTIYSIFREPSKELTEPLGSAEPRLKNTVVITIFCQKKNNNFL